MKGGMSMLPCAPDKCQTCATAHAAGDPHNKQSLFYQMRFANEHDRSATWKDAMAHCTPEVRARWTHQLRAHGETVPE